MSERPKPKSFEDEDMLPEYAFDYSKARPNPYAARLREQVGDRPEKGGHNDHNEAKEAEGSSSEKGAG